MFAGFIKLLPQSDIRDFSIDDADVGPPLSGWQKCLRDNPPGLWLGVNNKPYGTLGILFCCFMADNHACVLAGTTFYKSTDCYAYMRSRISG